MGAVGKGGFCGWGVRALFSEAKARALAVELDVNPDLLLALGRQGFERCAGEIIIARPTLLAERLRGLNDLPDDTVLCIVRELRDGKK